MPFLTKKEQENIKGDDDDDDDNYFETLIDPSFLIGLTEEERREALAAAAAAKRAEERAEARALERAIQEKEKERKQKKEFLLVQTQTQQKQQQKQQNQQQNELTQVRKQKLLFQLQESILLENSDNSNRHHYNNKDDNRGLFMTTMKSSQPEGVTALENGNHDNTSVVFVPKKRRYHPTGTSTSTDDSTDYLEKQGKDNENGLHDDHNHSYGDNGGVASISSASGLGEVTTTTKRNGNNNVGGGRRSIDVPSSSSTSMMLSASEIRSIKQQYLGKTANFDMNEKNVNEATGKAGLTTGSSASLPTSASNKNNNKNNNNNNNKSSTFNSKKVTFKFRWDLADDTFCDYDDPLYANMVPVLRPGLSSSISNGRSGVSSSVRQPTYLQQQQQQQQSVHHVPGRYNTTTGTNHHDSRTYASTGTPNINNINNNNNYRKRKNTISTTDRILGDVSTVETVTTKPLSKMTARDWRIFRENYEIVVKGGKAPPPMRTFKESPLPDQIPQLHKSLLDSIENVFHFKDPSPIQRQAIPIGLQRRDLIGVAETGSGKTIAFGIPLCHYILNLPNHILSNVANHGPLGLIMAPTRELALQIDNEIKKLLCTQKFIKTCPIVGGQQIQNQAQELRSGVHIVVGTPGRINECIEMTYLVLNQCCYIIMDEADRMIDMGFAPQMESILDAMGGIMKSEIESEAYTQEQEDLKRNTVAQYRLTCMFSATMPTEVERIAKRYLRHPAVVSVGDQDSGKNARIVQKIVWLSSPAKKEEALRTLLRDSKFIREKIIVFVNEKKHADSVGRMVERAGRQCVVLHGGKSQEQREENLDLFRAGGIVMVATDVAGRGLDIPDVAHVINYDLPTRSIENYTHRIGRTGRAGKDGYATSFITDEDEGIMGPLRAYLESTGNEVPSRLARHPAANTTSHGGNHHDARNNNNNNNNNGANVMY